ncbi:hypothetical protein [Escherichia coli]|nr:hypothetical protein [Escherichia coli]
MCSLLLRIGSAGWCD